MSERTVEWGREESSSIEVVKKNGLGGHDFRACLLVSHSAFIVITEKDKVFEVDTVSGAIQTLSPSGKPRHRFSVHSSIHDPFLFVVGGKDSENDNVAWAQKFDVRSYKWTNLPDMQVPRLAPGLFITQDDQYLYAYLGQQRSAERLSLTDPSARWEYLDV